MSSSDSMEWSIHAVPAEIRPTSKHNAEPCPTSAWIGATQAFVGRPGIVDILDQMGTAQVPACAAAVSKQ